MATHSSLLPGKFYGQRNLVNYSLWDHKESDTTGHACIQLCVCSLSQSCPDFCGSTCCSPAGSSLCGILQARLLGQVAFSSSRDLSNSGIEPASPTSAGRFSSTESPGKPPICISLDLRPLQQKAPCLATSAIPKMMGKPDWIGVLSTASRYTDFNNQQANENSDNIRQWARMWTRSLGGSLCQRKWGTLGEHTDLETASLR